MSNYTIKPRISSGNGTIFVRVYEDESCLEEFAGSTKNMAEVIQKAKDYIEKRRELQDQLDALLEL